MQRCAQYFGDAKRSKFVGRVFHTFDLKPDLGQPLGNRAYIGIGIEMFLEPAERKLHAPTPPLSVGTSSAPKP